MTDIINHNTLASELQAQLIDTKLYSHRELFISEGIDSRVAKRIISCLLTLDHEAPGEPILMLQNSPGGEVNSGFAIYDTMRFIKSPIIVLNTGLCASIATIINLGAEKKNRLSLPNCRFLIHQPLIGGTVKGPATDLEITATEILKTREKINKLLSVECGQPLARVEKDAQRDYWMNAEEALEYGLISRIISSHSELKK